jgi:hypothetical protein
MEVFNERASTHRSLKAIIFMIGRLELEVGIHKRGS